MSGKTVLILGGGIGGLTAATHLRRLSSPAEPRIVVVERKRAFSACMANLWIMTGERKDPREGQRELGALSNAAIEVVHADVQSIDPAAKTVQTTAGELQGDYIIIALGAETNPRAVPGFGRPPSTCTTSRARYRSSGRSRSSMVDASLSSSPELLSPVRPLRMKRHSSSTRSCASEASAGGRR